MGVSLLHIADVGFRRTFWYLKGERGNLITVWTSLIFVVHVINIEASSILNFAEVSILGPLIPANPK